MSDVNVSMKAWRAPSAQAVGRVDFTITTVEKTYDVYISGAALQAPQGLETGACLALLAAMRTGSTLHVDGCLSDDFYQGLLRYQRRFSEAFPAFKVVDVKVKGLYAIPTPSKSQRCASFFSGGVDSMYTLLKAPSVITDIVTIHGFDVRLDDLSRREAVDRMASAVADATGTRYLPVESNFGKVLQDFGSWPQHAHGLALIAVARMLSGYVDEVRIPSSFSIAEQKPWGSWLATDPLLSDKRLAIVHDACEARRMDKIRFLAHAPIALEHLRVCWEREDGALNCCKCEKCLRTMTSLAILGVLDQATSFPQSLSLSSVSDVCLPRHGLRMFARENLQLLHDAGHHWPALEKALNTQLHRPIWWSRLRLKWGKRKRRLARQVNSLGRWRSRA